jgi:hypothetical protein
MVTDWNALMLSGKALTENGVEAEFVEFNGRERDSWGEAYEGDSECSLIFKVGSRYFVKYGNEDSYGSDIYWEFGEIKEVFPKTVTKTVYTTTYEDK